MRLGVSLVSQGESERTGTATLVRGLLREFSKRSHEIDVELLCNGYGYETFQAFATSNVRFVQANGRPVGPSRLSRIRTVLGARLFPRRLTDRFDPDVDVVHYPLTIMVPGVRLPSVVTVHDVQHYDLPANFSLTQRLWRGYFYRLAAKEATLVVTDSEHARERTIEMTGIAPERICAIHFGVDESLFGPAPVPDEEAVAERLGLPGHYVYYPASLWPHKNHITLIEAISRVGDDSLHVILTGATFKRLGEVMAAAGRHGMEGRIRHLGLVPEGALPVIYRRAAAMVFPSSYEGFGAPPLEAMACGCPVASSLETSLAEVCGDAALPLRPTDTDQMAGTIHAVLTDAKLRDRLKAAGFAQARRFSWQRTADAYLEIYRRAIALFSR